MAAATSEITIEVPGHDRTLTMHSALWALLGGDCAGWQLGGWVNTAELHQFSALWVADQILLTHPGEPPVTVSLRRRVTAPYERFSQYAYLKLRVVDGPRPHPAWRIQGQEVTA
jgi:hypothetical protein